MEIKEEAPDVFSFDLFSAADAARFLADAASCVSWVPALVYGKEDRTLNKEMRQCSEQELSGVPRLAPVVDEALARAARIAGLCWRWPVKRFSDTRLVRYETGDFISTHVDSHPDNARSWRQISLVCYLNDGYEGGETVFPRQRLAVTPRAGKAILFPSGITHPHGANAVTKGTRFVIVSWLG
jgi:predicted 2-oxoglutarate/Fe(II)-dependent dioxygenase YbiX